MSKERPSQRPQRPKPTLDPRIEPGSGAISYEDSVVLPPRRRSGEGPASRGRQPATSARATIPPPQHSPAEESELRRRITHLRSELSESNETAARLHAQVTAERSRNEELQRALDAAEQRAREAQKHTEHAQTESTSVGLRLAELEQNLEDTRAREHGLLEKNEALEQRVALLEEARDALKKEHDGAVTPPSWSDSTSTMPPNSWRSAARWIYSARSGSRPGKRWPGPGRSWRRARPS